MRDIADGGKSSAISVVLRPICGLLQALWAASSALIPGPHLKAFGALDEQQQVEPTPVAETTAGVTRLDGFEGGGRGDQVQGHTATFAREWGRFSGYCASSCNVISDGMGLPGTIWARKKPDGIDS